MEGDMRKGHLDMIVLAALSTGPAHRYDGGGAGGVRQEVGDDLWEAVAAAPLPDRREAERRAVARFGHLEVLAAQFAVVALAHRTRAVGFAVLLAIAGVLVTMKA